MFCCVPFCINVYYRLLSHICICTIRIIKRLCWSWKFAFCPCDVSWSWMTRICITEDKVGTRLQFYFVFICEVSTMRAADDIPFNRLYMWCAGKERPEHLSVGWIIPEFKGKGCLTTWEFKVFCDLNPNPWRGEWGSWKEVRELTVYWKVRGTTKCQ
jgi:hypothetical protein